MMPPFIRLLLLNVLFCFPLFAQVNPAPPWTHTWGGPGTDTGNAVARDSNGNIYVAGSTSSFGAGGNDVLLLKYAPDGTLLWQRTWGGSGDDVAASLVVDASGNLYIVGRTSSFGAGWYDALILKFDTNGSFVWARTWGGGSYDTADDITFDSSGNLAIAGQSYSIGRAAVLLKFGTDGTFLSTSSYAWKGPATYDTALTIRTDSQGNTILAGISWDYSVSPYHTTILILKFDSSGKPLFSENWSGPGQDEVWAFHGVVTDTNGSIYVGGRHSETCSSYDFSKCNADNLLLKLDPFGGLQWAKTWGGPGWDTAMSLSMDSQGNILVAGALDCFGTSTQMFVAAFDPQGNPLPSLVHTGAKDFFTQPVGLLVDPAGNVIVSGSSQNTSGTWTQTIFAVSTPSGSIVLNSIPPSQISLAAAQLVVQPASPTGVADTGGGGQDVLTASLSFTPGGPPPATHVLTVASTNPSSGVPITVSLLDNNNLADGTTQFTRTYNAGVTVTLGASVTAGGNTFSYWTGCDSAVGSNCTVAVSSDRTVTASYVTPPPPPVSAANGKVTFDGKLLDGVVVVRVGGPDEGFKFKAFAVTGATGQPGQYSFPVIDPGDYIVPVSSGSLDPSLDRGNTNFGVHGYAFQPTFCIEKGTHALCDTSPLDGSVRQDFAAVPKPGVLPQSLLFALPLPSLGEGGKSLLWKVVAEAGGYAVTSDSAVDADPAHTDTKNGGFYAIDFGSPVSSGTVGPPVLAVADGNVVDQTLEGTKGTGNAFGKSVVVQHPGLGNIYTRYAHLSSFGRNIQIGATVQAGQALGCMGTTRVSTGVHLHFQVYDGGIDGDFSRSTDALLAGIRLNTSLGPLPFIGFVAGHIYQSTNSPESFAVTGGSSLVGPLGQPFAQKDANGNWAVSVALRNNGNVTADVIQVKVTGTTLGTATPISLPVAITSLAPGASATTTITFPASAVPAGPLKVSGSYSACTLSGNWSLTFRSVTLTGGVPLT